MGGESDGDEFILAVPAAWRKEVYCSFTDPMLWLVGGKKPKTTAVICSGSVP